MRTEVTRADRESAPRSAKELGFRATSQRRGQSDTYRRGTVLPAEGTA